jgi:hypothetical protein
MALLNDVKKAIEEVNGKMTGGERFPTSYKDLERMYNKLKEYGRKFQVGDFIMIKGGTYRHKAVVVAKHAESG